MSKSNLNKTDLLQKLEKIENKPENEAEETFLSDLNFANALLKLVNIDQEKEYKLCYDVAKRLLGKVNEPIDPEEFQL